jgi:PadR family transcriptional regulator, regulatory protein PadR
MSPRPLGYATVAVLQALADGRRYGFDIIDHTGLPSGTVYPSLASLDQRGYVTASWEDGRVAEAEGRPRRRYYRLTPEGEHALTEALERFRAMGLGGVRAAEGGRS